MLWPRRKKVFDRISNADTVLWTAIISETENYSCVVDLLSRVGHLNYAMEFVSTMPIEPNEMVWQTLLGTCRIYSP
ncbi:putative pentatricopeptide repeat-containing protein, mitochondrial, partial [Cucurbita argyrosperma subsp. argyrosperma]